MQTTLYKILMGMMLLFTVVTSHAENRVALIIGNQNYNGSAGFETLPTCINDAKEMDKVLRSLGFSTIVASDANKEEMLQAIEKFSSLSKNADVAVYFFSGHAIRLGEDLYMVPSRSTFLASSLSEQLVKVSNVRNLMENNANLSILFLDACRDGTTTADTSKKTKGRQTPSNVGMRNNNSNSATPLGCMICYATQSGRTASAGKGDLSPFTKSLVKHLTDGDEFRTVWRNIKNEVSVDEPGQIPSSEDTYENMFYFNPSGSHLSAPNTTITKSSTETSTQSNDNKKSITINTNAPNATIDFYGSKFLPGKSLLYEIGRTYVYTIEAEGFQPLTGKLEITPISPSIVNLTLKKAENCTFTVSTNTNAGVTLDGKFIDYTKNKSLEIRTTMGRHSIKLVANGYLSYSTDIDLDQPRETRYFTLSKEKTAYWDWDGDYDGTQYLSYHFSPKAQIGLSYLYRPENSRISYGLYLSGSTGLFKGINMIEAYSYAYVGQDITYSVDENGKIVKYKESSSLVSDKPIDKYSDDIDPNREAKKYDAYALILANFGYHLCTGILIEAGLGAGFHQDRYYLPYTSYITKTVTTNLNTGTVVGEPKYEYIKGGGDKWFKQNSKWSPAFRLGAKALIPLDDWDTYFITLGGGYTFQFTNMKYSSWDATIGFAWNF